MKLLCAMLGSVLLLVGCASQQASEPKEETKKPVEQDRGHAGAPGSQVKDMPQGGELTPTEECQLNKVVANVGQEGANQLLQEWLMASIKADSPNENLPESLEDIGEAQDFSSFLAERGYTC